MIVLLRKVIDQDYDNKLINFYNTIYDTLTSAFGDNSKFYSRQNPIMSNILGDDIFKLDLKAK